jgi:hypothetical protein
MARIFTATILFIFLSEICLGQYGVRIKYNTTEFRTWDSPFNDEYNTSGQMLTAGYEAGLDYWFRLKKKRIEFMPEVAYAYHRTTYDRGAVSMVDMSDIHFNFHTHIYALDMGNDCNCPTFSKDGGTIDKGLFFHLTPGISYHNVSTELRDQSLDGPSSPTGMSFRMGLGAGVDFGISDLWTLTPVISYYFRSSLEWEGLEENVISVVNPHILQFSLRLGFRPDYKRSYRRR